MCETHDVGYAVEGEEVSGDCGPMPDWIAHFPDLADDEREWCDEFEREGCTMRWTHCLGARNYSTATLTFTPDGAVATGETTITMLQDDGSECTSSYTVVMTRL